MKTVLEFQDHKHDLESAIEPRSGGKRGFRSELAEGAGTQLSFLYPVRRRDAHFNLEHTERLNHFLEHNPYERHDFLLLLRYARAGSKSLQAYFRDPMKAVHSRRAVLKKRMKRAASRVRWKFLNSTRKKVSLA